MIYLQPLLDQIMATSIRGRKKLYDFFPSYSGFFDREDRQEGQAIQAWQQAETTVINQCTQLLSPSADPTYVMTYLGHSFPQHRQYLCAGAWMLMNGHPESINSTNLGRVLREFSPEEVTSNIYTMVDVLLHHIQLNCSVDILRRDDDHYALRIVISLLERPELQKRIKMFCSNRSPPEHWLNNQPPKRVELQHALGNHLSWKDRYPVFFDDIAARLLPVIPLIIYRLIENDATDISDRVLAFYSSLLNFHPLRFTFVRDILAYFYGHLPSKLIVRILKILDISKIPFSDSFPQHVGSSNPASCPPLDYFANLLLGLVNNVIPSLNIDSNTVQQWTVKWAWAKSWSTNFSIRWKKCRNNEHKPLDSIPDGNQLLQLCFQKRLFLSTVVLFDDPSMWPSFGTATSGVPCPAVFGSIANHKDCWWLADSKRSIKELDSAVGYALLDPTWASQDNTSTAIGNIVALLHAFFSNLPQEWLESTHTIIKHCAL
uniref:Mediator of RNA polymerase II transcription subunit 23 n=1 Tax=Ananas comosus var. bracteatus TaxID=296719 RepID=A0A6V7PLD7_ANACO|nr:unnamed protein product [Ananas comosus var. bracteatus]